MILKLIIRIKRIPVMCISKKIIENRESIIFRLDETVASIIELKNELLLYATRVMIRLCLA